MHVFAQDFCLNKNTLEIMSMGYKSEKSVREEVLDLVKDSSRIHNKPCLVSDIHIVIGNKINRNEIEFYLEDLVETNRDIKRIEGGYFYEGKEYITIFED